MGGRKPLQAGRTSTLPARGGQIFQHGPLNRPAIARNECSACDLQLRGQLKFFADQLAARAPTASIAAAAAASAGGHSSEPLPGAFQITCWQRRTFAVPKPTPGKPLHLSLWQQEAPLHSKFDLFMHSPMKLSSQS